MDFNDPITLQVLWNRLVFITDQADQALGRTAFSPIVRENHDFVTVLMDADGNALAQCTLAIPVFISTLPMAVKNHFLKTHPPRRSGRATCWPPTTPASAPVTRPILSWSRPFSTRVRSLLTLGASRICLTLAAAHNRRTRWMYSRKAFACQSSSSSARVCQTRTCSTSLRHRLDYRMKCWATSTRWSRPMR